ncbi:HlyD family efflux transporter periplasmic adaptor subunit [Salipiger sp. P9]|uniref:efflux RND transporter periplasmic adaptor subunit n=1 Tax=Salipiger pentaromativorans TaxID=2943193 RepID=UPI0021571A24|nr:HlyD family efflux transporter periplasmic adaptor subunit [Salipiger pentaromativorans]MCR8548697.1 HlyD family efflux transporter periplasmic adaptor subunit [Salipiger pentaromativorans]
MRFLRQSLVGLFLLSLTLGLLVYAGALVRDAVQARLNDTPRMPAARERVFAVNVTPVAFETVTPVLTAFGEIQSSRMLELRSAVGGTLIDFAPEFVEGGRVAAGQLLARIDPADMQAELERTKSALTDAEAELREARRSVGLEEDALGAAEEQAALRQRAFERQQNLAERNVGTAAAVEEAELAASSARQAVVSQHQALAQAEARVDQAETSIARARIARDEAQRRLDETEIRAEFDAQLSDVSVVAGRRVSANEQLAVLVDPDALEVSFRVSTQQYARLLDETGRLRTAPVTAVLDIYGTNLQARGHLSREGAAVGAGQTGRQLFATLDRAAGFKPGDFVTVEITEAPLERVARLPATALDAANEVLVVDAEERLEAVAVELLRRQGDDVLVRSEGLEGREVVMERTPLLGAGIKVRPLRAGGAEAAPAAPEMLELSEDRRARLVAFVEGNAGMPAEAKQRILAQLSQEKVPAQVVQRIEDRMGG